MPGDEQFCSKRGERLKYAMDIRGIGKMYIFAMEMQVSESTISRWVAGAPISLDNLVILCRKIDISIDWLLLGRGNMESHHKFSLNPTEKRLIKMLRSLPKALMMQIILLIESIANYS